MFLALAAILRQHQGNQGHKGKTSITAGISPLCPLSPWCFVNRNTQSIWRDRHVERADAVDGMLGGDFPFTERRAAERIEIAAAPIGLEHGQDRWRQRRQK